MAPTTPLPDFSDPPVIEVALSVLYKSLSSLTTAHIGSLWAKFRDEFPTTEDHPPLGFPVEAPAQIQQEPPKPELKMLAVLPGRTWFVSPSGTELIQVQHDRFAYNWRKQSTDVYPRYPKVRENFERHLHVFQRFESDSGLGTMSARQCEVSYVNHIIEEGGIDLGRCGDYVSLWQDSSGDRFLPQAERVGFNTSYTMSDSHGHFQGRLHVSLKPATLKANGWSILVLTLTARGEPIVEGGGGVMGFLDLGREWIVCAFAEITTPKMHTAWGRLE